MVLALSYRPVTVTLVQAASFAGGGPATPAAPPTGGST